MTHPEARRTILSSKPPSEPAGAAPSVAADPGEELRRVAALAAYGILDTDPEPVFDAFAALAASICGTPVGAVNFVDASRQWCKASVGMPGFDVERDASFCAHALAGGAAMLEIPDATLDPRTSGNPLVTGEPGLRFYAGAPLIDREGHALGALCALDTRPRSLDAGQRRELERAAAALAALVQARDSTFPKDLERLAFLGHAVEAVADPLAVVRVADREGADFRFEYANRAFAELFGYDRAELPGVPVERLCGPQTELAKLRRLGEATTVGGMTVERIVLYTKAGAARLVEVRESALDPSHRAVALRDLTSTQATVDALGTLNERLASLVTHHGDAVLTLDAHGICADANPAASALFGIDRTRLIGFGFLAVAEAGLFPGGEPFPHALARGMPLDFDTTYRDRDLRPIAVEVKAVPIVVAGRVDGAYVIVRNVEERNRLAALVAEQSQRTRSLYLIAASKERDDDARIVAALQLMVDALRMEGAYLAAVEGDAVRILDVVGDLAEYLGRTFPLATTYAREAIASHDVAYVEDLMAVDRSDRHQLRQNWRGFIAAPLTVDGRKYGAIGCVTRSRRTFAEHDVDFIRLAAALVSTTIERGRDHRRLSDLAYTDDLTGLGNRARLLRALDAAIGQAQRRERAFALHFVDLDGFKEVNDRFGHAAGDQILTETARRLGEITRVSDEIARLGGDEFVVVQPEIDDLDDARTLGRRIVARLSEPYAVDGGSIEIGASVGIARYPADGLEAGALLERADSALYRAKANGKRRAVTAEVDGSSGSSDAA